MKTYTSKCITGVRFATLIIASALLPLKSIAAEDATDAAVLSDKVSELSTGLNTVWMLLAAMLVFFMQPGFALVEAGFTRTKNTANILMKNLVDFIFGSLLFWCIGFELMFGEGSFVGIPQFFSL